MRKNLFVSEHLAATSDPIYDYHLSNEKGRALSNENRRALSNEKVRIQLPPFTKGGWGGSYPPNRVLRVFLALLLTFVCTSGLTAQQDIPKKQPKSIDPEDGFNIATQLESFDQVWNKIRQSHWDREMIERTWDQVRDEYRPQIESAKNVKEVRRILNKILDGLGQSHFGIIPFESYSIMEERKRSGGSGFSGLTTRLIDGQLIVTQVAPNSPAHEAGVRPGWEIKKIDDRSAEQIIEKTKKVVEHSAGRLDTYLGLTTDAATTGNIGDKLALELLNEDADPITVEFELVQGPGKFARLGHLPPSQVVFDSRELDDNIGYIRFNSFLDAPALIAKYNAALKDFGETDGLVIDLRGNRGGLVILVNGMCGWFVEDRKSLGSMIFASGPLKLVLNPRKPRFDKPVAVLIDECSISAAEIMAGGLKDIGVARIFGQASAGLVLPSVVNKLPNGDGFQYAVGDYASASGQVLEGEGVQPDEVVVLTRDNLTGNRDPVLDRATDWIVSKAGASDN